MRKRHMGHDSVPEKCRSPVLGAVEKLVRHKKFSRTKILFQRAYRAYGNNALHAEQFHRIDVRTVIDLTRQNAVSAPMPCQKRNALPFQHAEYESVRWVPKRRLYSNFTRVRQAAHRIETASADDADGGLCCFFFAFSLRWLLCPHSFLLTLESAAL